MKVLGKKKPEKWDWGRGSIITEPPLKPGKWGFAQGGKISVVKEIERRKKRGCKGPEAYQEGDPLPDDSQGA